MGGVLHSCISWRGYKNGARMKSTISKGLLAAVFALAAAGSGIAQHRDGNGNGHGNGRPQDQHQQGPQQNNQQGYHFRPEDRDQFRGHYQSSVNRYQNHPDNRRMWSAGQQLSSTDVRRFQPVPRSYYNNVPPPPPGYRFGYYNGNVYAYNPTTRIIADVLDLVTR